MKLPLSPIFLCIELGGKSKWLTLMFGYRGIIRTGLISWKFDNSGWLEVSAVLLVESWTTSSVKVFQCLPFWRAIQNNCRTMIEVVEFSLEQMPRVLGKIEVRQKSLLLLCSSKYTCWRPKNYSGDRKTFLQKNHSCLFWKKIPTYRAQVTSAIIEKS